MLDTDAIEIRRQIAEQVGAAIVAITGEMRKSSVEITTGQTGKTGFNVKVYNTDPVTAANRALTLHRELATRYGLTPVDDTPIETESAIRPEPDAAPPPTPARQPERERPAGTPCQPANSVDEDDPFQ